jgi:hypothetical protein
MPCVARAQAMGNRCLSFMLFMLNFLFVKVCKHLIILVNELGEKLITYREGVKDGRVIGGENVPRARLHSNPKKYASGS